MTRCLVILSILSSLTLATGKIYSQTFYNRIILNDTGETEKIRKGKPSPPVQIKAFLPAGYITEKGSKTSDGILKVYLDDALPVAVTEDFSYLLTLRIQWTGTSDTSLSEITVPLSYKSNNNGIANGQYISFHNITSLTVYPVCLTDSLTGDTISFSRLPGNAVLETELVNKSYIPCNISQGSYNLHAKYVNSGSYIDISWASQTCADFYELEWVYVDDYDKASGQYRPATALTYHFPHKAMRVRVNHNIYKLPGVFRHGYVIFRVRALQVDPNGNIIPSVWSQGDNYNTEKRRGLQPVNSSPANSRVFFDHIKKHEPSKNYFFEMFCDEEGQRHFNISYYDGQLVNRQNIDFFDSDSVHIVQQPVYDPLWRPVIQTLPAPLYNKKNMKYQPLLCRNMAGQEYKAPFWSDTTGGGICSSSLIPLPMSTASGSSRYFSPANEWIPLWQTTNDAGLYTPDAEGYPFTTTILSAEPDNRPRMTGGPGLHTQPGSGHATTFFYGIPCQAEIDRLLGNNAGFNTYYRKTVVQDPNGTVSEEISDLAGKVVISSLLHHGPQLLPVDTSVILLTEKMISLQNGLHPNGDTLKRDDIFSRTLILNGPVDIDYHITIPVLQDTCKPDCYDCVYRWQLFVKNACGQNIMGDTLMLSGYNDSLQTDTLCGNTTSQVQLSTSLTLPLNEYTYYRKLMLDTTAAESYFQLWIQNNPCLLQWDDFYEEPDTSGCHLSCDGDTTDPYVEMACNNDLPSFCETFTGLMLLDVSPTGQYAEYSISSSGNIAFTDPLSVLKPGTALIKRHFTGAAIDPAKPLYRYPQYYNGSSWHPVYLNEAGQTDTLYFQNDTVFVKNLLHDTLKYWTHSNGKLYTFPQFLKVNYFITWFKPSWAKSLLVYHPEFWYYYICLNDIENVYKDVSGTQMNSSEFDNWLRKNADSLGNNASLVCDILSHDPFFSSTAANTACNNHFFSPFSYTTQSQTEGCGQGNPVTGIFRYILDHFSGNLSLWQVSYLLAQCNASYPLPPACGSLTDSVAAIFFFNLYTARKQEILLHYLHYRANQYRGFNKVIGMGIGGVMGSWEPYPCDAIGIFPTASHHPATSPQQLGHSFTATYYKNKIKRWGNSNINALATATPTSFGSTMQQMGYPSSMPADTGILSGIYNAQVLQYQMTGLCPAAADLSQLLRYLFLQDNLFDTLDLGVCDYPGLALFNLTGSQSPLWQPSVSGNTLTTYLYPDNRAIYLTIDTPAFLSWSYPHLLSLQNLSVTDVSGGETHFTVSLWYMAADSSVQRTIVQGHTQLPIQECPFPPSCSYTAAGAGIIEMLMETGLQGAFASAGSQVTVNGEIEAMLDVPAAQWQITTTGGYLINISGGSHQIQLQCNHALPADTLLFYHYYPYNPDTTGCINTLMMFYAYSGGIDSVAVTVIFDGQPLSLHCCSVPQTDPCNTALTANTAALLQLINNILQNNISVPPPLTQYIHNNVTMTGVQNSGGNYDFMLCSGYLAEKCCQFHLEGIDPCLSQNIISATELIPLATYNNSTGQTYHFMLVYTAGDECHPSSTVKTDTLTGYTTCIPLVACPCSESPCMNFDFPPLFILPEEGPSPCAQALYAGAVFNADNLYDHYLDSMRQVFIAMYFDACSKVNEEWTLRFPVYGEYHTLYEYDDNGNLLRTVPPSGVHPLDSVQIVQAGNYRNGISNTAVYPAHTLCSNYRFNSQNLPTKQQSPDAGKTEFWYDLALRNAASQNAEQRLHNRFSYIVYDGIGRPVESGTGIKNTAAPLSASMLSESSHPLNWLGNRKEMVSTLYDIPCQPAAAVILQKNLRNRVSAVFRDDDGNGQHEHAQIYAYDAAGNVTNLVHDIPMLEIYGNNRYKTMHYDFDMISGKVKEFVYQKGKDDQWMTKYTYNSDNKIREVFTSRDGVVWERDARYEYYLHQPLKRTVTGESQVQGTDYIYTLQGWIKGVNGTQKNPAGDMGGDAGNGVNAYVARDEMAYWLMYHHNDYKPVAGLQMTNTYTNFVPLYNGNIAATMISQDTLTPLVRSYRYDGLNRLREQKVALPHNNAFTPTKSWNTSYTYDLMGNITTLNRNAGQQQPMDRFAYNYYPNSNKLAWVSDSVPATDFNHDIDNQQPANYTYDAVGNMTKDALSEITVGWNDYGKIKEVRYHSPSAQPGNVDPLKLGFTYDALASRLTKTYYKQNGNTSQAMYTDVYVRDPQGNPIATYTLRHDSLFLDELFIYGSQRIGLSKENRYLARKPLTPTPFAFNPNIKDPLSGSQPVQPHPLTLYTKRYELTDWLGNVRVVITNKKIPLQSAPLRYRPDVVSVTDYYAFGSEVRERSYWRTEYKYGFNGMIKDKDILEVGDIYATEFREYNPNVGRWFSVDPKTNKYPYLSPYVFSFNSPILWNDFRGDDPDGDGEKRANKAKEMVKSDTRLYGQGSGRLDCSQGAKEISEFVKDNAFKEMKYDGNFAYSLAAHQARVLEEKGEFTYDIKEVKVGDYIFWTKSSELKIKNIDHVGIVVKIENEIIYVASSETAGAKKNSEDKWEGGTKSFKEAKLTETGKIWQKRDGTGGKSFVGAGRPKSNKN
jgi:RHS repeat-associated protein